ncbi:MAG: hypothetical protein L6Q51_06415 [Cyclobacteriaceae bacterium]|nr:hypothetical protein [Cyclobacteriaceae bacterium]
MKTISNEKIASVKLIDGYFSAEEARDILLNLITSKINFHEVKNFASLEKTGKPDITALHRLPELREERKKIIAAVEYSIQNGYAFKITSAIRIELMDEGQ